MVSEKGYILPFAMLLTAAILVFSVSSASIFISRYSYLDVMESGYKRESLLLYTVEKLLDEEHSMDGFFVYQDGIVRYKAVEEGSVGTITLTLETDEKIDKPVMVTYRSDTKEILDWEQG
ncbi:competence type IV pilus minor pilin ComGG [Rossellomorea vietnamensis]|nr:competence type IV pilus minor pilin ComGG [Rossellomorea vietnamensis]